MNNNSFFIVAYKILSYLNYCYEKGSKVDTVILSAGTLNISNNQFLKTLSMLIEQGYLKGALITETGDGCKILNNLSKAEITINGLNYLKNDSSMMEAREQIGPVQRWLPIIK